MTFPSNRYREARPFGSVVLGTFVYSLFVSLILGCAASGPKTGFKNPAPPDVPTSSKARVKEDKDKMLKACAAVVRNGLRSVADTRDVRFEGKVAEDTAL